ncbi:MAG TPA: ATP-binding protein [Chloroflexota bacterium]|nr:ATP-binding protein [Chloroflexota bacterium]
MQPEKSGHLPAERVSPSFGVGVEQVPTEGAWRMAVVYEIAKILSSAPDLSTLLDLVVERLVRGVDAAEASAILLFSDSTQTLEPVSVCGLNRDLALQMRLRPDESMTGLAFSTGRAQLFPTPNEVASALRKMSPENRGLFDAALTPAGPPHSVICAPLISRGERLGVLVLENLRGGTGFIHSDLGLLQALADLIALAVQKERLQKEAEQARVLQEANRLKSELLSTLSHEMRTPLASIKGYSTALLLDSAEWDEPTREEFLRTIDEETDNLQNLIGDLLESSTIEAGLLRIERQPVLLERVAGRVVEQARLRTRKHRFALGFPRDFPVVDADPHRIEQVLHNLVDNSVKYSPDGGLIVIRGEARPGEVTISVADQGVGIAPEHLNRLFERFFRVKSGLGPKVTGTGLGLPIARTIVEAHGGHIWAESQVGAGTTLFFTLPSSADEGGEDDAI